MSRWLFLHVVVTIGLVACLLPQPGATTPGADRLVMEEFTSADSDGFPLNW
jgi:hypothetical protein